MAYDEYQAERVDQVLKDRKVPFFQKKMMGGLIFMVNEKMCVGLDIDKETGKDRLMVRIGKEAYAKALEEKGAREMDFTGRVMRGFLFIDPDGWDQQDDLEFWVDKALAYNKDAPKSKPKRKKKGNA